MTLSEGRRNAMVQLHTVALEKVMDAVKSSKWSWVSHWSQLLDAYEDILDGKRRPEAAFWLVPPGEADKPGSGVLVGASQAVLFGQPVEVVAEKCYFRTDVK